MLKLESIENIVWVMLGHYQFYYKTFTNWHNILGVGTTSAINI